MADLTLHRRYTIRWMAVPSYFLFNPSAIPYRPLLEQSGSVVYTITYYVRHNQKYMAVFCCALQSSIHGSIKTIESFRNQLM